MDKRKILELAIIFTDTPIDQLQAAIDGYYAGLNMSTEEKTQIVNSLSRIFSAKIAAQNVPRWKDWTPAEAQTWYDTNIGTPLQTDIPANVTLANIRPILVAMLNIMRAMGTMLFALGRMILALRDDRWS